MGRIFAMFPLQEIAFLAHRSGPEDTLQQTIAMTTGLQVTRDASAIGDIERKPRQGALTM